jgi:hypothetical protein
MSGDWIKIEHWTQDKPEVFVMADELGIDPDAVLGKLVRTWVWADQQTFDGNAVSVTFSLLDRVSGQKGFADALLKAGWLKQVDDGVQFVNFDRHNGETAKTRALTAKRVKKHRAGNGATPQKPSTGNATSVTLSLPEKRREEKNQSLYGGEKISPETQTQIAHDFSDVVIPTKMQTPECAATAARWFEYLSQIGAQHKRPDQSPIALQEWWMQMARLGPEGFHDAVNRSIVGKHQTVKNLPDDILPKGPTAKAVDKAPGDEWQRALMVLRQHHLPNKTSAAARKAALPEDVYKACATVGIVRIAQADQYSEGKIRESFEFVLQEIRNGNVTT